MHDAERVNISIILAILLMSTVLASSGCLVEEEKEPPEELEVPEDRKDRMLFISGNAGKDVELTMDDMLDMGLVDFEATFVNSVGTTFTANYSGVRLIDLLDLVDFHNETDMIRVQARDGYNATVFLDDIDETTHIAVRKENEWNDLNDAGAFQLVDTDLPSVYWVRDVNLIVTLASTPIWSGGLTDEKWLIEVDWIRANSTVEVSWQEGIKTRTYNGVPMSDVLDAVGADLVISDTIGIGFHEEVEEIALSSALADGVLLVDSKGQYVYYPGPDKAVFKGVWRFYVGTGVNVHGEVGAPYLIGGIGLADVAPVEWIEYKDDEFIGPRLDWLVAEAAPNSSANAVKVVAGDGYFAVFPMTNLSKAIVAVLQNGVDLEIGFGPFRIIDTARPGPFHVGWVVGIEVFTSPPLIASGAVNVTDAIDLTTVDTEQDTEVTYNDGRKDRTYPAISWDVVLQLLDWNTSSTNVTLWDSEDNTVIWEINELLDMTDAGICVDSRGNLIAVREELGDYVSDVVKIEVD
jgi:DMSO/TMAO reductase YedYZ molybdopterin-dependent catalytic subunit